MSESKYQIITSYKERRMKFVVIANPTDLNTVILKIYYAFFCYLFYKMSKDCSLLSKKQTRNIDKKEILLNLFI